jgi:hypothetical protein
VDLVLDESGDLAHAYGDRVSRRCLGDGDGEADGSCVRSRRRVNSGDLLRSGPGVEIC